jgi:alginate biosynthesis protein Alg44
LSIVHESEVQRQHVRLQLPMYVQIGGESFSADDWSNSGVALQWGDAQKKVLGDTLKSGSVISSQLCFAFEGFDLNMPMQLEVRYVDTKKNRVGFRFIDLNTRQTSLLRHVVSAYVAGEVVRAGDLIHIAGRSNFSQPRKIPSANAGLTPFQRLKNKLRKSLLTTAVALCSTAAFAYVVLGMYERTFVVKTNMAQVSADFSTLASTVTGRVYFQPDLLDKEVKKGQPLLMVQTDKGNMVSVDSPCDCIVKKREVENEAMVSRGDVVLRLLSVHSIPFIETRVPAADAVRLAVGKRAVLEFAGHKRYLDGKIIRITSDEFGAPADVLIQPSDTLPVSWVDDPVEVRFDTLLFSE